MTLEEKREANRIRFKKFYSKNLAHRRAYIREWSKDKALQYLHQTRAKNPEQYKARTAVSNALRLGKIVKPLNCSVCGLAGKLQGHHEDYSKPLDVRWICKSCHYKAHGKTFHGEIIQVEAVGGIDRQA